MKKSLIFSILLLSNLSFAAADATQPVKTKTFNDLNRIGEDAESLRKQAHKELCSAAYEFCYNGPHSSMVSLQALLDKASPEVVNRQDPITGDTLLHHATITKNERLCEALLLKRANPFIKNSRGRTAIDYMERWIAKEKKVRDFRRQVGKGTATLSFFIDKYERFLQRMKENYCCDDFYAKYAPHLLR